MLNLCPAVTMLRAILAVCSLATFHPSAWARECVSSDAVCPPGSTIAGRTIGEWTVEWWKWAAARSGAESPVDDPNGANAEKGQSGPVFFVAGTRGGSAARSFTIPSKMFVLLPVVNYISHEDVSDPAFTRDPDGERADMEAKLSNLMTSTTELHATMDGRSFGAEELRAHVEVAPEFYFSAAEGNVFGIPSGRKQIAHARGYYLMLPPLATGDHLIAFGGMARLFAQPVEVTAHISVQ